MQDFISSGRLGVVTSPIVLGQAPSFENTLIRSLMEPSANTNGYGYDASRMADLANDVVMWPAGSKGPVAPTCPEGMTLTAKTGKCVCVTPGPVVKATGLAPSARGGSAFTRAFSRFR